MKIPLITFGLLVSACVARAEPTIVTTVVVSGVTNNTAGGQDWIHSTNVVVIPAGQAARVATMVAEDDTVTFTKAGWIWPAQVGDVIAGPAEFTVRAYGDVTLLTLERWKVTKAK